MSNMNMNYINMINNSGNYFGIPNINNNMNIGMNMGMNGGINVCPNYMNNYNNGMNFGNIGGNYMNNMGMNMYGNTMNVNNMGMFTNGNTMNMNNIGINMSVMNNINMNNAGINMNGIKNDNITINIQFPEGNTIQHQISSSKYIHELIDSIRKSYDLKFNFKLKFQNKKNLVNSMTLSECGLDNYSKIIISKIEEEDKEKYSFSRYKKQQKQNYKIQEIHLISMLLQLKGNVPNLTSYFINPKNKEKFESNNNTLISLSINYLFNYIHIQKMNFLFYLNLIFNMMQLIK